MAEGTILPDGTIRLTTWRDFAFEVRPAREDDEPLLADFFDNVTIEDRRFRFLSGSGKVGHAQLAPLVDVDHELSENFLAFDGDRLIGTAMLAAVPDRSRAEVAISLHRNYKQRGIGWSLLEHLAHEAEARGIRRIEAVETRENRQALAVEQNMGFRTEQHPDDPDLVLVSKELGGA